MQKWYLKNYELQYFGKVLLKKWQPQKKDNQKNELSIIYILYKRKNENGVNLKILDGSQYEQRKMTDMDIFW